jgi:hypothetical protein
MRIPVPSRRAVGVAAMTLVIGSLGMIAAVFVARPASAAGSASSSSSSTTTSLVPSSPLPPTSTAATTTTATDTTGGTGATTPTNPIAAKYFVINGSAHAASDHEVVGSSAFPNYATGAVDNYYSMALSHVDNSPFAQGTASPADTGPVGQTAAAGNFQQPQYADARWPGSSGKATYGTQGQPYAIADASEYKATAESSEASSGLNGTSPSTQMAAPKGFDGGLRQALAAWKAKWQGRLHPKTPTGAVKPPAVTIPTVTVTTPAATVTTPTVGGLPVTPPVSVPPPAVPSALAPQAATPSRSMSSASTASGDGASLLESSTLATLDDKAKALVTTGESRLGRVSLGGGQIVIQGIHVSASITNDGTPTEKIAVDVGAASIGGVPVTIDQDGVHVSGQGAALPYQQASDALNGALKQAGIQLFIVTPEIKKGSSGDGGAGGGTGPPLPIGTTTTDTTTTGTTTTSSGGDTGTTTTSTTPTTTTPCQGTGTTTTTTNPTTTTATTTTTTTTTPTTTGSAYPIPGTGTTTTTTTTTDTNPSGGTGTTTDSSASEETVRATGLHVVFTQPVEQAGVPTQYIEHILGEVFLDSLAVPAGALPNLGLNLNPSSSASSSCAKGAHSGNKKTSGGASIGGGSSAGKSSGSPSGSTSFSGSSQPTSGVAGSASQPTTSSSTTTAPQSFPVRLASALRKPIWLLLAYVLWQALVIGTGASLWAWRRGEAS